MTGKHVGAQVTLPELEAIFAAHGGVEPDYLRDHHQRFIATWQAWADGPRGHHRGRMLDLGSHWLHQTIIWRLQGFEVTAVDVAATIDTDIVRDLATRFDIQLCRNDSLEHPDGLAGLPDEGFDLILMSEVIEHLAFNPIALWRELHRLLAPDGVIVLTTPNYYALRGRAWHWWRFLSGRGGGLGVRDILHTPSFGHHWREYSRAELIDYFALLSPDFRIERALRLPRSYRGRPLGPMLGLAERLLPPLRDQLYLEVGLDGKRHGITAQAQW